jgi:hypothetical protein
LKFSGEKLKFAGEKKSIHSDTFLGRWSLVPASHSTPTQLLLPWHAWSSDCSSLPSRFSQAGLSRQSPAFALGPVSPPAFFNRVRQLPFDEPDGHLTPRQSGEDPGVLPVEQVPWPCRGWAGQPASPGGPRGSQRSTGSQYPVTGCTPVSVPPTSVPRLAHRQ